MRRDEAVAKVEADVAWKLWKRLCETDQTLADLAAITGKSVAALEWLFLNPGSALVGEIGQVFGAMNCHVIPTFTRRNEG